MTTIGTKEWADTNVNIYHGCSNDCVYCYARGMAIRFKRKTKENWKEMDLNIKAANKGYKKRKGRIMFPSSHDITLATYKNCLDVLQKILEAGNDVLITTKPDDRVIKFLCKNLVSFRNQIQFRFTITALHYEISATFEPNAPYPDYRLVSLRHAYLEGYKTSISIEPFLQEKEIIKDLILATQGYVTESIWIGPMNKKFCPPDYWREDLWGKQALTDFKNYIESNEYIMQEKIRWKDGFLNAIADNRAMGDLPKLFGVVT